MQHVDGNARCIDNTVDAGNSLPCSPSCSRPRGCPLSMTLRPLVSLVAVSLAALLAATPEETTEDPCGRTSWLAGTTELCNGILVYRDYVYDDYGADTGAVVDGGFIEVTAGDQTYPPGQENTADLVDLRLWINGDQLHVRAQLNTLFTADSTTLAVALDTDLDPSTGGGVWGVVDVASEGWDTVAAFTLGDPVTNVIVGTLPLADAKRFRVQAVLAQSDGTVMNVAFRGVDEEAGAIVYTTRGDEGSWFEDRQARALAAGDITEFGYIVDTDDLRAGVTRRHDGSMPSGLHERVYVSDVTLGVGEGIADPEIPGRGDGGNDLLSPYLNTQSFRYLGRYQPYGIYVPETGSPPYGVQYFYHGSGANHVSGINQPGVQRDLAEDLNRILVVPLGRGPAGCGSDYSERDILDVMDDVDANLPVDVDRVFSGGYSQGGYVAQRMASLYPDRFAGLINWVGFTGDGFDNPVIEPTYPATYSACTIGNARHLVRNLRHVPSALLYAGADEVDHVHTALTLQKEYQEQDTLYEFFLHPVAEHFTFAVLDEWKKEAEFTRDLVRVKDPARVTFRTDLDFGNPELGILHDRAYWISELRGRESGYIEVDITSRGCGLPDAVVSVGVGAGPTPVPWASTWRRSDGEVEVPQENRFEAVLMNVRAIDIDVDAACLASGSRYVIDTDGPTDVSFSDGRSLRLDDAGRFEGIVPDVSADSAPQASATSPTLPATGGGWGGIPVLLLCLIGLIRPRISPVSGSDRGRR